MKDEVTTAENAEKAEGFNHGAHGNEQWKKQFEKET
jgi:hypothetical protein